MSDNLTVWKQILPDVTGVEDHKLVPIQRESRKRAGIRFWNQHVVFATNLVRDLKTYKMSEGHLRLGVEKVPVLVVRNSKPQPNVVGQKMIDMMREFPLRYLINTDSKHRLGTEKEFTVYYQNYQIGPDLGITKDGIIEAWIGTSTDLPKEYYNAEGKWTSSEYEYMAREFHG